MFTLFGNKNGKQSGYGTVCTEELGVEDWDGSAQRQAEAAARRSPLPFGKKKNKGPPPQLVMCDDDDAEADGNTTATDSGSRRQGTTTAAGAAPPPGMFEDLLDLQGPCPAGRAPLAGDPWSGLAQARRGRTPSPRHPTTNGSSDKPPAKKSTGLGFRKDQPDVADVEEKMFEWTNNDDLLVFAADDEEEGADGHDTRRPTRTSSFSHLEAQLVDVKGNGFGPTRAQPMARAKAILGGIMGKDKDGTAWDDSDEASALRENRMPQMRNTRSLMAPMGQDSRSASRKQAGSPSLGLKLFGRTSSPSPRRAETGSLL